MSVFTVSPHKRTFLDPVLPGMGWYGKVSANAAPVFSVKFIHIYVQCQRQTGTKCQMNIYCIWMHIFIESCAPSTLYIRGMLKTTAYVFDTGQT